MHPHLNMSATSTHGPTAGRAHEGRSEIELCPICDVCMVFVSEERPVTIGSRTTSAVDEFFRCHACGEEVYLPGQMEATQIRAARAVRAAEGLLQPEEIRAIREGLSLSQHAFERLLGVGPKTVVRWERGTVFQSAATNALLRVLREFPEVAGFLAQEHGIRIPHQSLSEQDA